VQIPGVLTFQPKKKNQVHEYAGSEGSYKPYQEAGETRRAPEAVIQTVSTIKMLKNNVSKYLYSMFMNGCREKDVIDLFPLMEESMRSYHERLMEKKFCANHYWGDRKLMKAREIVGSTICQIIESQEWLKYCLGRTGLKNLDHENRKHLMPLYLNEALPANVRDMNYIYH